jgi:hypothetical protein
VGSSKRLLPFFDPTPRISIFGHAHAERNRAVLPGARSTESDRPRGPLPKNLGKNRGTHAGFPVRGLGAVARSFRDRRPPK